MIELTCDHESSVEDVTGILDEAAVPYRTEGIKIFIQGNIAANLLLLASRGIALKCNQN